MNIGGKKVKKIMWIIFTEYEEKTLRRISFSQTELNSSIKKNENLR